MKEIILILFCCILATGCSTIASKSHYDLMIKSDPAGASLIVSNRSGKQVFSGSTPVTMNLSASSGYFKNETYTIELNKAGYDSYVYRLSSSLDGWYWGNILVGGILGMLVVDPATGAMYKLPESLDIALNKKSDIAHEISLNITTVDKLDTEQMSRLKLIGSY